MSRNEVAAGTRVRIRLTQIQDRLSELRERSQELIESPPSVSIVGERLRRASSHASQARIHAVEAARLARVACLRSAAAHDRVADLYEQLLASGSGDSVRYVQEADRHRLLAARDRAAVSSRPSALQ